MILRSLKLSFLRVWALTIVFEVGGVIRYCWNGRFKVFWCGFEGKLRQGVPTTVLFVINRAYLHAWCNSMEFTHMSSASTFVAKALLRVVVLEALFNYIGSKCCLGIDSILGVASRNIDCSTKS